MAKTIKREIGDYGENLAVDFLAKKGYKIVARNFLITGGELDIIAWQNDELVFVEVKTRKNIYYGYPEEGVTFFKKEKMAKAIRRYLLTLPNIPYYRVDIIAVELNMAKKLVNIKQIKNVFCDFEV